jgi:hypothetical protein
MTPAGWHSKVIRYPFGQPHRWSVIGRESRASGRRVGVGSLGLGPGVRRQFGQPLRRQSGEPGEHIVQVGERVVSVRRTTFLRSGVA